MANLAAPCKFVGEIMKIAQILCIFDTQKVCLWSNQNRPKIGLIFFKLGYRANSAWVWARKLSDLVQPYFFSLGKPSEQGYEILSFLGLLIMLVIQHTSVKASGSVTICKESPWYWKILLLILVLFKFPCNSCLRFYITFLNFDQGFFRILNFININNVDSITY